ncbi:hypothetical protein M9H77_35296 [Catharanthus roseus]|uniref:Uncharacterized protein n=1 Tax=Catharanthus roseus TaxID=4058 RepID=A0ACB9ZPV4_CATRO|nr:hypothetical protein M9H77_35296 [Catharanthus roseus]
MASSSPPLATEEVDQENHSSVTVQEMVNHGVHQPPNRYICKDPLYDESTNSTSLPSIDIPVIDLSRLATDEELQKLHSALSSLGCFQVINHGIEVGNLGEMEELVREFFRLPKEEKQKYARPADDIEGYGTDIVLSESQTLDWTDRLYLLVIPEDGRKLQFWPQNPKDFRRILHEYSLGVTNIIKILLQSAAKMLDLPENSFLNQCGEKPIMFCRFNLYPPCPRPEQVLGLKPHTDGSGLTILLPDKEVEGLQLVKDNKWYKVAHLLPHALLVNAGDQLEIMSNGIFKSPMHRAVTNLEKERISVAMFWAPELGKEIGPLEGLINEERPRRFAKLKDYHLTYFKHYQLNQRAIDAVRIN